MSETDVEERQTEGIMVNLNDYFDPVSIEKPGYEHLQGPASFSHNITIHTENAPIRDISKYRIAILGIPEDRNSPNTGSSEGPDSIRTMLYRLSRVPGKTKIIDLGNMKRGKTFADTLAGLTDILTLLLNEDVFALIIGGSSATIPAIDKAFSASGMNYTMATIDSRIDFHPERKVLDSYNYLNNIIYNSRGTLKHFINIGYQTYLNDPQIINRLLKRNCEIVRVGDVRQAISLTEPLLRDTNAVLLDISAVRQSDAPATPYPSPNGFYGEEICLLARYSGISDNMKIFGLFEVNPSADRNNQTSGLASQIIWFFLEGFSQKQFEVPSSSASDPGRFIRFHVRVTDLDDDLIFVRSNMTDRWWLELRLEDDQKRYIACSHEDYLKANRNEVPDRWIKAISRFRTAL
jgi:arginase family enzyme